MHWTVWQEDKPFVPNLEKFGFVYIITHIESDKAYVGCKQYCTGKKKTPSKWETYTGSSKYLNADIEKDGKEKFKFEVIAEYINKRSLRYYEAYYQMKWDVLTATLKDSDKPAFYNSYVGGKFFPPIEMYQDPERCRKISDLFKGVPKSEEHKKKISEAKLGVPNIKIRGEKHGKYRGKVEFYLNNKRMVVDCLGVWCKENGYIGGYLHQIADTIKNGFYIHATQGKRKALSYNGPLGTITKVKWLDNGKQ